MKLTIEINLDNAAFSEHQDELARMLAHVARDIAAEGYFPSMHFMRDTNGNRVGTATLEAS